jgi:hypothetical protein
MHPDSIRGEYLSSVVVFRSVLNACHVAICARRLGHQVEFAKNFSSLQDPWSVEDLFSLCTIQRSALLSVTGQTNVNQTYGVDSKRGKTLSPCCTEVQSGLTATAALAPSSEGSAPLEGLAEMPVIERLATRRIHERILTIGMLLAGRRYCKPNYTPSYPSFTICYSSVGSPHRWFYATD